MPAKHRPPRRRQPPSRRDPLPLQATALPPQPPRAARPPWKVLYLANIIVVLRADGYLSPRETLIIEDYRARLDMNAELVAEAIILASDPGFVPFRHENPITDAHNLEDMILAGLVDELLGEAEISVIGAYAVGSGIPAHRLLAAKASAMQRAAAFLSRRP